jgi:hypothetical protein
MRRPAVPKSMGGKPVERKLRMKRHDFHRSSVLGVMRFVSCDDDFDELSHRAGSGDKDPITEASPVRGAEVIGAFCQGICL